MTDPSSLIASEHAIPPAERAILNRLLDLMIPSSIDGQMPSAGELDLYAARGRLTDAMHAMFCAGLRGLAEAARKHMGTEFVDLDTTAAMTLVEAYRGEASAFFAALVTQSAARYYQHDRVLQALGLEPRPPWPEGHAIPEGDWSLLDPVRARAQFNGKIYRD